MNDELIQLYYFKVTDIWKRFCEEHNLLFDLTCEEYSFLLKNNMDAIEEVLLKKINVIETISLLESLRAETIEEINNKNIFNKKIVKIKELLPLFKEHEISIGSSHLERFNDLLIEIIEKIQNQNRINQMFITKSLRHLKELREVASGNKSYDTYNAKGNMGISNP